MADPTSVEVTADDILEFMDSTVPDLTDIPAAEDEPEREGKKKKKKHHRDESGSAEGSKEKHKKKHHKKEKEKKKKKKKQKTGAGRYVDDAAGGSSSDESEEGDIGDAEIDDLDIDYIKNHKIQTSFFKEGDDLDAPELVKKLEARYRDQRKQEKARREALLARKNKQPLPPSALGIQAIGGDEVQAVGFQARKMDPSERFSAAFLPRDTDPKVFAVKVRPGFTRILVTRIVNKCHAYLCGDNPLGIRQDLGIISAFSVDHVKEWIYLEAYRRRFVESVLTGLEHVFRFKIAQVDPKDLMQLFERQATAEREEARVGSIVRFKYGPYVGDMGIVTNLLEQGRKVQVKVVPREDFVNKHYEKPTRWKKGMRQLPQRHFVPTQALGTQGNAAEGSDVRWGELLFDCDGYLLKTVGYRQLLTGSKCAKPTVEELQTFYKGNRDKIKEMSNLVKDPTPNFALGDKVICREGQNRGLIGTLSDVHADGHVSVEVNVPGFQGVAGPGTLTLRVRREELGPHFDVGSHIVIERGNYEGDTGTVVHTTNDEVIYLSDDIGAQRSVSHRCCRASPLCPIGKHSLPAKGKLHDLVILTDGSVGCLVKLNGLSVTILLDGGEIRTGRPDMIQQKASGTQSVTDRFNNAVKRGDPVKILEGLNKNIKATVEHVHMDTLFCYAGGKVREHSGMLAVRAKDVSLIGGTSSFKHPSTLKTHVTAKRPAHTATIGVPASARHIPGGFDANSSQWSAITVDHPEPTGHAFRSAPQRDGGGEYIVNLDD